jgi:hypothetical protein
VLDAWRHCYSGYAISPNPKKTFTCYGGRESINFIETRTLQ